MRWFLREWARRNYAFEIRHVGHEAAADKLTSSVVFLALCILAGVFYSAGVAMLGARNVAVWRDVPNICWIFWGVGTALFVRGLSQLKK